MQTLILKKKMNARDNNFINYIYKVFSDKYYGMKRKGQRATEEVLFCIFIALLPV